VSFLSSANLLRIVCPIVLSVVSQSFIDDSATVQQSFGNRSAIIQQRFSDCSAIVQQSFSNGSAIFQKRSAVVLLSICP